MSIKEEENSPENQSKILRELWGKYEDIAMHFNELLIKLRTQALGAVATLATIVVGLSSKIDSKNITHYNILIFIVVILILFWFAVWVIDLGYYNKLLNGSVKAIIDIEEESKNKKYGFQINMSTEIEKYVSNSACFSPRAVWYFYAIVTLALICVALFLINLRN